MTRWAHLHDLGKSVVTVAVAVIALGVNFLDKDFSWDHAATFLAVAYCLLAFTIILSLWSMASVSDYLPDSPGDDTPPVDNATRMVLPANLSFFFFALAMLLVSIVGISEVTSDPDQQPQRTNDILIIIWDRGESV